MKITKKNEMRCKSLNESLKTCILNACVHQNFTVLTNTAKNIGKTFSNITKRSS